MEAMYTADIKPQNKGTRQLFQNPILEKLSRTHISVPLIIFSLFSSILLYWSITHTSLTPAVTMGMFVLGFVIFTWVEYMTHRHVFHMKIYTETRKKIQYLIHGVHHEFPRDKERLAMPPLVSITIATLLLLIFRVFMGDFVFSFLPGFLTGYAFYLSIHYMVHAYQPPKNFMKTLWINHSVHHYKNGEVIFGVSSPFWDYLYGTMKSKDGSGRPHLHHP
jgi:sterol desaturase/sphingolipid hydroxylase (fatty acid hydroxylase superfamily)